jgi:hypothetical protein
MYDLHREGGNLTVDFMFSIFLLLLVLASLTSLIWERLDMVEGSQELAQSRILLENIAGTINQVYAGGEGHSIRIHMPPHINQKEYQVTVNSSGVFMKLEGRRGWALMAPEKFSRDISLKNSAVTLLPDHEYLILNLKDGSGYSWIVIKED